MQTLFYDEIELFSAKKSTALTQITLIYSETGLCRIYFGGLKKVSLKSINDDSYLKKHFKNFSLSKATDENSPIRKEARKFFAQFTAAKDKPAKAPTLDLRGTPFQKAVWQEIFRVTRGRTRTYGEIAKAISKPKAVRAVGTATGANPLPLLIPCHRILASGGALGGFSGGLPVKIALLQHEGILIQ